MKTCPKCGDKFPATPEYFHRDKSRKDSLSFYCKDCVNASHNWPEYYQHCKERNLTKALASKKRTPEQKREDNRRFRECPRNRLSKNTSHGMYLSILKAKSGRSWESLVGYTLDDLMAHLESQFQPGMTWENYGEWHIDHRRPISDFTFASPDDPEFKECWSLWNLQPLWAFDNISKGPRCEYPPLPLLHGETA